MKDRVTLLVCGSRTFNDVPYLWSTLDKINEYFAGRGGVRTVILPADDVTITDRGTHGAAHWAMKWSLAKDRSIAIHRCEPEEGENARELRDKRLVTWHRPEAALAFSPDDSCTGLIALLEANGVRVWKR